MAAYQTRWCILFIILMNLYKLAMHMTVLFYTYNEPFYLLFFVAKIMNLLSSVYYIGKKKIKGIIIFSSSVYYYQYN